MRLKYSVDTAGLVLPYADMRVRPYSIEETLTNVLTPFDFKFKKVNDNTYRVIKYEYPRRTEEEGRKMTAWLSSLYDSREAWEERRDTLRREFRELLAIDSALARRTGSAPVFSAKRKHDGYTVSNFYLETLPGLYVCGSVYAPSGKGRHPLIVCPNGHFAEGRYNEAQQTRLATLARMGAVCVSYDLYGWGESALQVGAEAHSTPQAQVMQALNGISILDFMIERNDVDPRRVGVNGGSGGGSQSVMLSVIDPRYTALCPVVSLSSYFDGGCPCESGMAVNRAGGGTCNAELAAMFAPLPLRIVSDGKDWTNTVPENEYPYIRRIYGFYGEEDKVSNIHLAEEGHDFGPNKRQAVYDFFIDTFGLDRTKLDETKVTIEPAATLKASAPPAKPSPPTAIRK